MKSKWFTPNPDQWKGVLHDFGTNIGEGVKKSRKKLTSFVKCPSERSAPFSYTELAAGGPKTSILTAEPEQR